MEFVLAQELKKLREDMELRDSKVNFDSSAYYLFFIFNLLDLISWQHLNPFKPSVP